MDFEKARAAFADDVEAFLVSGKGKTKLLPETKPKRRRLSLRKKRKRDTTFMQAHITAVLEDMHSCPTEDDPYRTRGGSFSAETEKVISTSQSS